MYGRQQVPSNYTSTEVLSPPSNNSLPTNAMAQAPLPSGKIRICQMINNQVDHGCLQYLIRC